MPSNTHTDHTHRPHTETHRTDTHLSCGRDNFCRRRGIYTQSLVVIRRDDGSQQQSRFISCVRTGFENPDSGLGCYAMSPSDYETFAPFFDAVCQDYHKADASARHVTDWDASAVGDNGVLDVTKLGLSELSMRVRVGRNLASFNLPGAMDKDCLLYTSPSPRDRG